jgi:hypothetical protein
VLIDGYTQAGARGNSHATIDLELSDNADLTIELSGAAAGTLPFPLTGGPWPQSAPAIKPGC